MDQIANHTRKTQDRSDSKIYIKNKKPSPRILSRWNEPGSWTLLLIKLSSSHDQAASHLESKPHTNWIASVQLAILELRISNAEDSSGTSGWVEDATTMSSAPKPESALQARSSMDYFRL